jgi:O-antigen/teichoic acid export membrane protein
MGMTVVWALLLFFFDVKSGRLVLSKNDSPEKHFEYSIVGHGTLKPHWDAHILYRLTKLALPLGVVMLFISLNANIPRYFIEHHLGIDQLGVFAAIAYLIVAGNIVVGALGQSASPRLSKYYAAGDVSSFRALLWKLLAIGATLGVGGLIVAALAGGELLSLIYTAEYGARADLFAWLMVVALLTYSASFIGYGMTAARYFKAQFPLFAIVTGSTVLACYWLIPTFGLTGAALAMIVAALVQIVGSVGVIAFAIRKIHK